MTTTTPPELTRQAVQAALIELLTTGPHHHAATPATLATVGQARLAAEHQHSTTDLSARCASDDRRLAALTRALGRIAAALLTPGTWDRPDPARLRPELADLAAVALAWLDTLPAHPDPSDGPDEQPPF